MQARLIHALTAAVAAVVIGCGDDEAGRAGSNVDCATYQFPTQEWKQGVPAEGQRLEKRRQAVDALIRCDVLPGKTEGQVIAILGSPSARDREGWIYTVGEERSAFAVDSEQLQVLIDDGKVSRAILTQG